MVSLFGRGFNSLQLHVRKFQASDFQMVGIFFLFLLATIGLPTLFQSLFMHPMTSKIASIIAFGSSCTPYSGDLFVGMSV